MEYIIEIASADQVQIDDTEEAKTYPSELWESVAHGNDPLEALEFLLRNANAEEFNISNSWLRMVIIDDNGKVEVRTY